MKSSKVVYSKAKEQTPQEEPPTKLPHEEHSKVEFLKTKNKMISEQVKTLEAELKVLREENDKLRTLNNDYVKQLNQMSMDKFKKIEKIVVSQQFFEQKNIETQLKDFIRKLTTNFSSLEREHAKLIDHCRIMERDINDYKYRVDEAERINENLRATGKTSIEEVMDELRELKNRVDELTNNNSRGQFDLAVKQDENERLRGELEQAYEIQQQLETAITEFKTKHNRMLSDHEDKFNKDAKFIYQLKLKSDFLEYERRLAFQDAQAANQEKTMTQLKARDMEHEIDVLRNTTNQFMHTNKHIFDLSALPKMQFK